nr:hypothetical protein [Rhodococcus gordoniae]
MTESRDKPVKANIFAAGAVLWRGAAENAPYDAEVALVHRPPSAWLAAFPQGKLDAGERSRLSPPA